MDSLHETDSEDRAEVAYLLALYNQYIDAEIVVLDLQGEIIRIADELDVATQRQAETRRAYHAALREASRG